MSQAICGNCLFFSPEKTKKQKKKRGIFSNEFDTDEEEYRTEGTCWRYPPTVITYVYGGMNRIDSSDFSRRPAVYNYQMCAEFKDVQSHSDDLSKTKNG